MLSTSSPELAVKDAHGFLVSRGYKVAFVTGTTGKHAKKHRAPLAYGTIEDIVETKYWPGQETPTLNVKVRVNENCVSGLDCGNRRVWTVRPNYVMAV